ncbi:MAG: bifunctional hydroxymethylpyrimidine kinase/phosphomethylpyrimidine kinase [Lentisphaerae bacterium]|nr:bifunctional hydroxymethylpyrimidine kinase/phosphomethylpyrimidine kinase [Lentisphaerota bacterium]OQC17474.1 MAG: Hydroxymethylpyrimidine/phosphomethylpyrimidine kinase [Lentisphaerae bacterium ADurb.Bin082]
MILPHALTIAGSDSGGGAGIQADLKTFSALGVYGMSAITAVTVQNTTSVLGVQEMPPDIVAGQIDAVFSDIRVDAVKIGMQFSAATIVAVAACLRRWRPSFVVLDPVMISKSGCALMQPEAGIALQRELLPIASLVTPNIPEAEAITGLRIKSHSDMEKAAAVIVALGAKAVLLKGGHSTGNADDLFFDGRDCHWLPGARLAVRNTHGTGCTLSSAIAAFSARGMTLLNACRQAKDYVRSAMTAGLEVGHGCGPLHHFFQWYGGTTSASLADSASGAAARSRSAIAPIEIKDRASKLEKIISALAAIRSEQPLVHHLTNLVTVNDCANAVLAIGGSPIMAPCQREVGDMAGLSRALLLNIGTPDEAAEGAMIAAGQAANAQGIPVVLDPVGVAATPFRRALVEAILNNVDVAIVRGNLAEIKVLADLPARARGVKSAEDIFSGASEADASAGEKLRQACCLVADVSRRYGCVIALTGAQDVLSDGKVTFTMANGHPMLARIMGTGCMASSLCATFAAVLPNGPLLAAAGGITCLSIAGEIAGESLRDGEGTGAFHTRLIDALSLLSPADLQKRLRCSVHIG